MWQQSKQSRQGSDEGLILRTLGSIGHIGGYTSGQRSDIIWFFFSLRSLWCGEEISGMEKRKLEDSSGVCSGHPGNRMMVDYTGVVMLGWWGELTLSCILKAALTELVHRWHVGQQCPGWLICSAWAIANGECHHTMAVIWDQTIFYGIAFSHKQWKHKYIVWMLLIIRQHIKRLFLKS